MAAEAAVSFAVETLGSLLIEKAVFLKGVKGEVEWVRNELKRMQCFLKDAGRKQSDSDSVRNWISEIREVAHDSEDAIEMFVLNVENAVGRSRGILGRCACFPDHVYHLSKVGESIKSIRKKLKDIESSRLSYGIQDLVDHQPADSTRTRSQLVESQRRLAYWQKDKEVVGLEKDVELLLEKAILEKKEGLSVAAIVGMGGIGKSTLASQIYNHPAVADRFEWRAWVVVSSEFTPEDIIKQIMLQLRISVGHENLLESINDKLIRQEVLQEQLHEQLKGKRYFIVLDDVWEATHWESLRSAFPREDNKASRVLLTSRNQVMEKYSQYVHKMKLFDDKQSWELFLKKVFIDNTDGKCPEEFMKIGEEILEKCDGLPLAISVVGGLLVKKKLSEWEKFVKEMKSHLDRSGGIDTILAILELSYQNLPPELKACFLSLSFFKEDAIVKAKNLVHIWVAQGLVAQEVVGEEETMEDVARDYLNELITRNMVQVKESEYDRVKSCHMHDLLRDLSLRKAIEEINFEVKRKDSNYPQSLHKPRHRAIYYNNELSFVYSTRRNQLLRSLFIYGDTNYTDGGPSFFWESFELLRVLDLGNARLYVLPKAIGVLTGLRYFKTYFFEMSKLPRSWGKLKNLEVLVLRGYVGFANIIIDEVVLKMDSLRHLYAHIIHSEVPLGNARNLQTLSMLVLTDSSLWQVARMTGASKLGFDMSQVWDAKKLFTHLTMLGNLVCLSFKYYKAVNMDGFGTLHRITRLKLADFDNMERLPDDLPPNISYLTLTRMPLTQDPMPGLERLPKLLYLKLRDAFRGEEMVISRHGFPKLKVLCLQYNMKLRDVQIGRGAMLELEQLMISNCPVLNIDNLPEHLKSAISTDAD